MGLILSVVLKYLEVAYYRLPTICSKLMFTYTTQTHRQRSTLVYALNLQSWLTYKVAQP